MQRARDAEPKRKWSPGDKVHVEEKGVVGWWEATIKSYDKRKKKWKVQWVAQYDGCDETALVAANKIRSATDDQGEVKDTDIKFKSEPKRKKGEEGEQNEDSDDDNKEVSGGGGASGNEQSDS